MKELIKKLLPKSALSGYHKTLALVADFAYGRPSQKLIVIGVTGTNGKSSTVSLIAKILEEAGNKVGSASTVSFKVAGKEWLNDKKMTMLGRFQLQKLLKQMVDAGCTYAVVETSSQGIDQFRHLGIHYDVCVFTNLTPEHIEAHGGFANYQKAKLKLFKHLESLPHKKLPALRRYESEDTLTYRHEILHSVQDDNAKNQDDNVKKAIIANGDDEYAQEFLDFQVDKKIIFGLAGNPAVKAENVSYHRDGISFEVDGINFDLKLFGKFNVYNSLAAIATAKSQLIDLSVCRAALEKVTGVAGRMEFVETNKPFNVLIDYAPEPESMRQLFTAIKDHQLVTAGKRIIHVFGSCGGGRDVARRPILGELSGRNATISIVTNEDPYDDDPQTIIDQVAEGAIKAGKTEGTDLFKVSDRREAIRKAFSLAQAGDLVVLTGKGAEQAICVGNGQKLPWDDREVAKEELAKLG